MEATEYPDDPNLRAFDALMRDLFPRQALTPDERALIIALAELDHALCELRDLVAVMRSSLAELRALRAKREAYKPWH